MRGELPEPTGDAALKPTKELKVRTVDFTTFRQMETEATMLCKPRGVCGLPEERYDEKQVCQQSGMD